MNEKKIPVLSVVAILGSTEASAVDNLDEVVQMRKEFAKKVRNHHSLIRTLEPVNLCSINVVHVTNITLFCNAFSRYKNKYMYCHLKKLR